MKKERRKMVCAGHMINGVLYPPDTPLPSFENAVLEMLKEKGYVPVEENERITCQD
ncbi:hypothetical protein Ga0466249_004331 [Sporomusaceae bacterium BoRhaA]|uniref:hypothetical protein n=1 Tax=Pelorhabdus rhamnosifermentans TaxID=2772457 RepID=UPI001C060DA7|nr:hypothetical protein [Pelorhabdus rhamnosifermentans]MBU2703195.1 hypothetical protein [Pelorhabdus rhamnosifermentans]